MNKKIKVIELINLIYQNMNVPQKIRYEDEVYIYEESTQDYYNDEQHCYLFEKIVASGEKWLLNEVEIIEDEEEIDIKMFEREWFDYYEGTISPFGVDLACKMNEIIKKINELEKKNK